jgi:hypothetical protein
LLINGEGKTGVGIVCGTRVRIRWNLPGAQWITGTYWFMNAEPLFIEWNVHPKLGVSNKWYFGCN